ncbi:MAG: response regulator [Spirochaetaceae bacterium]
MTSISIIDDDHVQIVLVKTILSKFGYDVKTYYDPKIMLSEYSIGSTDLILSDIHMPGFSGLDLLNGIRTIDKNVPFIMFTSSSDIKSIISHFKKGISDYLLKPVNPDDLVHRIERVLEEKKVKKELEKIEHERELIELERRKLVNWRTLYANKETRQTEQMMSFFTRSINSGCGYVWLDILNDLPKEEDGSVILDKDLFQLVSDSAGSQRKAFDYLSFITNLPEVNNEVVSMKNFAESLSNLYDVKLKEVYDKDNKDLSFNISLENVEGNLNIASEWLLKVIAELCINASKFSPENSRVIAEVFKVSSQQIHGTNNGPKRWILFQIRNELLKSNEKDEYGEDIIGIPYDYIELVYDLFYTIESFPTEHPSEEWSNGTGLYIARYLIKKMNGSLTCKNMIDYTNGEAKPYVQFQLALPITDK